jgi:hypothetical protein
MGAMKRLSGNSPGKTGISSEIDKWLKNLESFSRMAALLYEKSELKFDFQISEFTNFFVDF